MAKLVKKAHDIIDFIIDKGHGAPQRRADIDLALYYASMELFDEYLDEYEKTKKLHEDMTPFEIVKEYTSGGITNGQVDKPNDYRIYTAVMDENNFPVDVIDNKEWGNRIKSAIDFPTSENPIVRFGDEKIDILPADTVVKLLYLTNPPEPKYVETGGVYDDDASTDLGWKTQSLHKLLNRALNKLGISLRAEEIIQYANLEQAKEV